MPRGSFDAPLGNPVNPRRMPSKAGMEFAQAIRPENPETNDDGTVRHVISLTVGSAAMSFLIPRVLSWVIWPQGRALLALAICAIVFTTLYLVALTGMFAGRKILSWRTFDTHIFMLATCGAVVLAFQIDGWHVLLVAAALLVVHSCLVMRHYVHHETAAPCDKAAASVILLYRVHTWRNLFQWINLGLLPFLVPAGYVGIPPTSRCRRLPEKIRVSSRAPKNGSIRGLRGPSRANSS